MGVPDPTTSLTWLNSAVISGVVTTAGTIAVGVMTIYNTRRVPSIDRNHSKRLAIIDVTRKRLKLQNQLLRLELAASEGDSQAQGDARQRAEEAAKRSISEANSLMALLEWEDQLTRAVMKKSHNLRKQQLSGVDRLFFWTYRTLGWLFLCLDGLLFLNLGVIWLASIRHPRSLLFSMAFIGSTLALMLVLPYAYWYFTRQAKALEYPKPDAPILDKL